jgi:16S rRNA (cytosine967-C5)-methyltransferase
MDTVSPARKAAFAILSAVERGKSHSDDLLRGKSVASLSAADRNLATALVLGVLRWQIQLDDQIQKLLARPGARLDPEIRIALRIGAFQLLHLDRIPARAAIDESVELAKQAGHRFASGMVNAVLRKLAVQPQAQFPADTPAELALATAHPAWLVERWVGVYGLDAARTICRHGQSQPELTARLVGDDLEEELAQTGIILESGELLNAARNIVSGEITNTVAFRDGRIWLQDEGSQLVAEIAGRARASAILDCCAAPGGKTLILAERNPMSHVVACESSPQRLAQMRMRLAPLGSRIECRLADATALPEQNTFDLVLADVPCSGTGTLGRNPEIRHRLRIEDLERQAERQRSILSSALRSVRPGSHVVYSTCSLEPEENEQVVASVLEQNSNTLVTSIGPRINEMLREGILTASGAERLQNCTTPEGYLRLLPGSFQTDGFFVALIERTA